MGTSILCGVMVLKLDGNACTTVNLPKIVEWYDENGRILPDANYTSVKVLKQTNNNASALTKGRTIHPGCP